MVFQSLERFQMNKTAHKTPFSTEKSFLSLLNALTAFYLVIPLLFFAYGWLKWPINLISILFILYIIIYTAKDIKDTIAFLWENRRTFIFFRYLVSWGVLAASVLVVWISLSGIGGLGFQNDDYRAKNALLNDLINQPFPLTATISGVETKIVYYYNYYLPAVIIGKAWGWIAANIFIVLWSFIGISIAFIWFYIISQVSLKKGKAHRLLLLVLIFCLAGGLDIIGAYVLKGMSFSWSRHIEFWAEYFQYSSNTTLVYWVPQHAIPAWLLTGMLVSSIYKSGDLKYVGISVVASILWSPFAVVGIIPYLLLLVFFYTFFPERRRFLFPPTTFMFNIIAFWLGIISALYIGSNKFSFPITFIWNVIEGKRHLIASLLKFWFVEFGFLAFIIAIYFFMRFFAYKKVNSDNKKTVPLFRSWFSALDEYFNIKPAQFSIFTLSLFILIILPFLKMGLFNDIVMRSSIPALFILWATVSKIIFNDNIWKYFQIKFDFLYFAIIVTLIGGFFTGCSEIVRSIENYELGPPSSSLVASLGSEDRLELVKQRAGNDNTFFYRYIGK